MWKPFICVDSVLNDEMNSNWNTRQSCKENVKCCEAMSIQDEECEGQRCIAFAWITAYRVQVLLLYPVPRKMTHFPRGGLCN